MELGLRVFCSVLNLFAVAVPLFFPGSTGYSISPAPAISHSEGPSNAHSLAPQSSVLLPPPAPPPITAAGPVAQTINGIAPSQSPVTKSGAPPPSSAPSLAPTAPEKERQKPEIPPSGPLPPVSVVSPPSKSPQKAPNVSPKQGSAPKESERNKSPDVNGPMYSPVAPAPKETLQGSPPTGQPLVPRVQPFISPAPVAPPPRQVLQNSSSAHPRIPEEPPSVLPVIAAPVAPPPRHVLQNSSSTHPRIPGEPPSVLPVIAAPVAPPPRQVLQNSSSTNPRIPEEPPSVLPAPSSSINQSRTAIPIPAPPNEIRGVPPPLNPLPKQATSEKNTSRHANNALPPLSSPKSPPSIEFQSPPSSLPTSVYKHRHGKENTPRPSPLPFSPPASGQQGPIISLAPSYSPKSHPKSGHKNNGSPAVGIDSPPAPPFPSPRSPLSHQPPPSPPPPSRQTTFPSLSPKASPGLPPSKPKVPVLPLRSLPPPPPNQDCEAQTCSDPFTNTPPGSPCGCVWPLQVELRLSVALYTFFPLVAEFAEEIAAGVFMKLSQIRIMGANADTQDPDKTTVLVDLVPLGEKFDNTTAYFTFKRFWLKLVPINASLFGSYEVIYVHYPGLPPSPPSSINVVGGQPYSDHGNNGRTIQPLGVDVKKGRHKNGISGGIIAIIVLSASATVVLCCAVAWVLLFKRGHDKPEPSTTATVPSLSKPSGVAASIFGDGPSSASLSFASSMATYTGSAKTFSSSEIQRATDSFNASKIIGEGGFGRVYSGVLEDGTEVAVKVLKRDDQHGSREFLAEVEMLSRLHHRNLVKLIGICTEERSRCLVYELIRNGSLESHLHGVEKETTSLDWGTRLKIALGAARGLAYLHEDSSPRVIHRDFKSSNILLEHDFTPKVSDFGLARTALDEENRHVSTRVMGTFGYVAPEYAMTGHLLVKSDVYSYGVVLLELLTGRKPVDMSQPPGEENLVAWARPLLTSRESLESIIDVSLGPDFPFDSIAKVAAIASMCVQPEVSHRPFMGEVVQALKLVVSDEEGDEARELGSRCCSQEDLSIEMNDGTNTNSDQMAYGMQNHSPLSDYDAAERGLSMSDFFGAARVGRADSGSFRMPHSSSGPLGAGKGKHLWQKMRRLSH